MKIRVSQFYGIRGGGEKIRMWTRFQVLGEASILWSPDAKSWLIGEDPDAGKDWRREETGTREDEMVGWCHQLDGHEFEQALGLGDGQGGLVCCSPWGHKESDMTEWLNWTELKTLKPHQWRNITFLLLATLFKCPRNHKWIPNKHNAELEGKLEIWESNSLLYFIRRKGGALGWNDMPKMPKVMQKKNQQQNWAWNPVCIQLLPLLYCLVWRGCISEP